MIDLFRQIMDTPIPTLLVIGEIVLLILAVASTITGHIVVDPKRQHIAAIIGVALVLVGIVLSGAGWHCTLLDVHVAAGESVVGDDATDDEPRASNVKHPFAELAATGHRYRA